MQGWRKNMEDSHINSLNLSNSGCHVFGVFDGHGGKEVALWVKSKFCQELSKNKNFKLHHYQKALQETFLYLDTLMQMPSGQRELSQELKKSKQEESKSQIKGSNNSMPKKNDQIKEKDNFNVAMVTGCTANVCLINNKTAIFANAGDSRAIIIKNGIAYQMTVDHKPDLDEERNRIYKAEGWVTEGRVKGSLNLSRSLGDLEFKQNKKLLPENQIVTANPEITSAPINDVDFIFLGCDGVFDCLSNQEIANYIYSKLKSSPDMKLTKILEEMLDEILATDLYSGISL